MCEVLSEALVGLDWLFDSLGLFAWFGLFGLVYVVECGVHGLSGSSSEDVGQYSALKEFNALSHISVVKSQGKEDVRCCPGVHVISYPSHICGAGG